MPQDRRSDPAHAVGEAIQNLTAARLGRAFVPLGVLFCLGFGRFALGVPGSAVVGLGAVATVLATLAYGLRIVQRAFARPPRLWMDLAVATSVLPPVYGLYVLGWEGLRRIAAGPPPLVLAGAILHAGLGVWVLRSWMKVVEIQRLAQIMLVSPRQDGGTP